jgi:hypothetical protein
MQATELHRPLGDNNRTMLEGLEAPATEIYQAPDIERAVTSGNSRGHNEGEGQYKRSSNSEVTEHSDSEMYKLRSKGSFDADDDDLYTVSDDERPLDRNRTVINIVQTEMTRPLGDNMRTHLEGMEDGEEIARLEEERDPYIAPVRTEMRRELGNNQRSYIEGMAEKEEGEDDESKKKKKWYQR